MFALEDADHEMLALAGVVETFKFDGGADAGAYRQFSAARASEDAPKDKRRTIATSHFEPTISPSGSASQDNRAGVWTIYQESGGSQLARNASTLPSPIDITEANDIVLAKIAPHLHLDELERNFPGVGEAMNAADRDIHRFVFMHIAQLLAERDLGSSLYNHPVLGAMKMLLQ